MSAPVGFAQHTPLRVVNKGELLVIEPIEVSEVNLVGSAGGVRIVASSQ